MTIPVPSAFEDKGRFLYNRVVKGANLRIIFESTSEELLAAGSHDLASLAPRPGSPTAARLRSIITRVRADFSNLAEPRGVFDSIAAADFESVYRGRGDNMARTPVGTLVDQAHALALFAVTLGPEIGTRIREHFTRDELAEGYLLDQMASMTADALASIAADRFAATLGRPEAPVLPYSPGYCGWHVSGQHALFDRLRPGEIGITLNDSGLMRPLKSVSGVLVAAPVAAHDFDPIFPCCEQCRTMECRQRIAALKTG